MRVVGTLLVILGLFAVREANAFRGGAMFVMTLIIAMRALPANIGFLLAAGKNTLDENRRVGTRLSCL